MEPERESILPRTFTVPPSEQRRMEDENSELRLWKAAQSQLYSSLKQSYDELEARLGSKENSLEAMKADLKALSQEGEQGMASLVRERDSLRGEMDQMKRDAGDVINSDQREISRLTLALEEQRSSHTNNLPLLDQNRALQAEQREMKRDLVEAIRMGERYAQQLQTLEARRFAEQQTWGQSSSRQVEALQREVSSLKATESTLRSDLDETRRRIATQTAASKADDTALRKELEEARQCSQAEKAELENNLRRQLESVERGKQHATATLQSLETELRRDVETERRRAEMAERALSTLELQCADLKRDLSSALQAAEVHLKDKNARTRESESLQRQLQDSSKRSESEKDALRRELQGAQHSSEAAMRQVQVMKQSLADAQVREASAQRQVQRVESQVESLKRDLGDALRSAETQLLEKSRIKEELERSVSVAERELVAEKENRNNESLTRSELQRNAEAMRQELDTTLGEQRRLTSTMSQVTHQRDELRRELDRLMKEKQCAIEELQREQERLLRALKVEAEEKKLIAGNAEHEVERARKVTEQESLAKRQLAERAEAQSREFVQSRRELELALGEKDRLVEELKRNLASVERQLERESSETKKLTNLSETMKRNLVQEKEQNQRALKAEMIEEKKRLTELSESLKRELDQEKIRGQRYVEQEAQDKKRLLDEGRRKLDSEIAQRKRLATDFESLKRESESDKERARRALEQAMAERNRLLEDAERTIRGLKKQGEIRRSSEFAAPALVPLVSPNERELKGAKNQISILEMRVRELESERGDMERALTSVRSDYEDQLWRARRERDAPVARTLDSTRASPIAEATDFEVAGLQRQLVQERQAVDDAHQEALLLQSQVTVLEQTVEQLEYGRRRMEQDHSLQLDQLRRDKSVSVKDIEPDQEVSALRHEVQVLQAEAHRRKSLSPKRELIFSDKLADENELLRAQLDDAKKRLGSALMKLKEMAGAATLEKVVTAQEEDIRKLKQNLDESVRREQERSFYGQKADLEFSSLQQSLAKAQAEAATSGNAFQEVSEKLREDEQVRFELGEALAEAQQLAREWERRFRSMGSPRDQSSPLDLVSQKFEALRGDYDSQRIRLHAVEGELSRVRGEAESSIEGYRRIQQENDNVRLHRERLESELHERVRASSEMEYELQRNKAEADACQRQLREASQTGELLRKELDDSRYLLLGATDTIDALRVRLDGCESDLASLVKRNEVLELEIEAMEMLKLKVSSSEQIIEALKVKLDTYCESESASLTKRNKALDIGKEAMEPLKRKASSSEALVERMIEKESEVARLHRECQLLEQRDAAKSQTIDKLSARLSNYEAQSEVLRGRVAQQALQTQEEREQAQENLDEKMEQVKRLGEENVKRVEDHMDARLRVAQEEIESLQRRLREASESVPLANDDLSIVELSSEIAGLKETVAERDVQLIELQGQLDEEIRTRSDRIALFESEMRDSSAMEVLNQSVVESRADYDTVSGLLVRERHTEQVMRDVIRELQRRLLAAEAALFIKS